MTTPKTVFIVGAGASCEFNLPSGNQLKTEIGSSLNIRFGDGGRVQSGDPFIYEALHAYSSYVNKEVDINRLLSASRHISSAMPLAPSIDNFIHVHNGNRDVELCGKLAIARKILQAEANSELRRSDRDDERPELKRVEHSWLAAVMKFIGEDCTIDQLAQRLSHIQFIIFNYDRCVEHFLYHAIRTYYGISEEFAAELVNGMAIYHPYGTVGKLPWSTAAHGEQQVRFGGDPNSLEILTVAKGIKTFTEGTDDESSDIIAIRSSLEEAQRIVFLGFAYHRLNVQLLLGAKNLSTTAVRRAFGTAWGMSKSDIDSINGSLSTRLHAPSMVVRNDIKCADIFHEYSRSLAFAF